MRTMCILIIALVIIPFALAEETFYSALESKEAVEAEGATVDGGEFEQGKFGNGFVSREAGDVIHFPVENNFTPNSLRTASLMRSGSPTIRSSRMNS